MVRGYQYRFSDRSDAMFERETRQRKARTMVCVLSEYFQEDTRTLSVLDVGSSTGVIDEYLSRHFHQVTGIDIDQRAIAYAKQNFQRANLRFEEGDAMDVAHESDKFDVVICSQVYEHVPSAETLMKEIFRVLKPGGAVYFAAGNRIMLKEPHYSLPLLSVLPRRLAHVYLRLTGKGTFYYEEHLTYWGLKKLVSRFEVTDFTRLILRDPEDYGAEYMIRPGSLKHKIAKFVARFMFWMVPGYIWVLKKPDTSDNNP